MGESKQTVCPSCKRTHTIYGGKWTLVCACGYLLYLGTCPERVLVLRDEEPRRECLLV